MNTRHVPDLEHCQEFDRLCKEKGIVMPETEFYWHKWSHHEEPWLLSKSEQSFYKEEGAAKPEWTFPAPLVSEQGEWLPLLSGYDLIASCEHRGGNWVSFYMAKRMGENDFPMGKDLCKSETEPNARQKMINYLIAEGIVTVL